MLSHPDPEVQQLLTLLERERDDALVAAGQGAARVALLVKEIEALQAAATKLDQDEVVVQLRPEAG